VVRLAPLALTLLLLGCAGPSAEEEAQLDWEMSSGPAWAAYEEAYRRGVPEGCESASEKIHDEDPAAYFQAVSLGGLCSHPPESPQEETPSLVPDDPEAEGYKQGLYDGCEYAYFKAQVKESWAACPVD
jgi:hypothetical protein